MKKAIHTIMRCALLCVLLCTSAAMQSCSFLHDDEVVASVAGENLHKKDVLKQIPSGLSAEDSTAMAKSIINSWAVARIIEKKAKEDLSHGEKDVKQELEEYKNALLRYRFEQRYIETHLDTTVTREQVLAHYEANKSALALSAPIMKVRCFRLPQKSRDRDKICKLLKADGEDDIAELVELGQKPARGYADYGGKWVSVVDLARGFGMDYGTFLAKKNQDSFVVILDEQSEENIIFIVDQVGFGKIPPVEYCENDIKEVIVSKRRYELSKNLDRDLLDEAAKNGEFEIYESNEK